MRIAMACASALIVAGCTATVSDPGQAVPDAGTAVPVACNPARAEAYVGKSAGTVAEEARAAAGARAVRVIGPGQAVTMDFRPDRLNVETDAAGTITKLSCG